MGNLESASDNLDEAMEYFNQAVSLRLAAGDPAAILLATTYICIARVYFLKGEYDEAFKMTAQCEALFVRTAGADNHFLAKYGISRFQIWSIKLIKDSVCITYMETSSLLRRSGDRPSDVMKTA